MNYKLCELSKKFFWVHFPQERYNLVFDKIQSYQNRNKITFHSNSFLFACFSIALECRKCPRMRFHCATVLVVLSICTLRGNIADDAKQMDVHKKLYPFYTTKEMPYVTVTITKTRFVGSNSQVY